MNRFIISLRTLSEPTDSRSSNGVAGRFSQFSAPNFRVPSNFLGNIGEPLVHGDPVPGDDDEVECEASVRDAAQGAEAAGAVEQPVAGPSGVRWQDEEASAEPAPWRIC